MTEQKKIDPVHAGFYPAVNVRQWTMCKSRNNCAHARRSVKVLLLCKRVLYASASGARWGARAGADAHVEVVEHAVR